MKRRIGVQSVLIVLSALLTFLVGSIFIVQNNLNKATEMNLRYFLEIIKIDYLSGNSELEIIEKYAAIESYIRITFVNIEGDVLADSLADQLENHLNRPEFQDLGGVYVRTSQTLGRKMMYLASLSSEAIYIRIAIPSRSIMPFVNDFIGLSIWLAGAISLLAYVFSSLMVRRAMTPFTKLNTIMSDVLLGQYNELLPVTNYPEINEILIGINEINRLISDNITTLSLEKQKTDFLLEYMNQGLCVLDAKGNVILVNRHLRSLFSFDMKIHLFHNHQLLFLNFQIHQVIEKAYSIKGTATLIVEVNQSYYSVVASYTKTGWDQQPGVVLLFTDVTAMKNIEILKRDFFVNASHELKSPLTSIMGSAELMTSGMITMPEQMKDLGLRIFEEAKRMNKLVIDMLSLSKYENITPARTDTPIQLKSVLHEIIASLEPIMAQKGIQFLDEAKAVIYNANQEHMEQLLRNIIENSIQYGIDSGWVKVRIYEDNDVVYIEVQDNGIGIPMNEQGRVFERFYRVDKARSKKSGGTGLGLSIVKHIVLMYQGEINLSSAEGKGTTITITLPKNFNNR
ncbi:MAG: ATP-binding protein [Candidatus Izemoplasmatales bacterium]|nr:ATP-binding protein [Candidatus Izemoplasmatales bacterium]